MCVNGIFTRIVNVFLRLTVVLSIEKIINLVFSILSCFLHTTRENPVDIEKIIFDITKPRKNPLKNPFDITKPR